jgi:hypothetical protein
MEVAELAVLAAPLTHVPLVRARDFWEVFRAMRIDTNSLGKFIIIRGQGVKATAFAFFVDDDSSSWTNRGFFATQYAAREEAEKDLAELRYRKKLRHARFHGLATPERI